MADKIKLRAGSKAKIPTLAEREMWYCKDENAFYIGTKDGNKKVSGGGSGSGVTFTPSVSQDGVISWTNDGNLENPAPVNIKGESGVDGHLVPEFVSSVDEMTDSTRMYVLESTGTVWEYGETVVDDTDRNLFIIDEIALNQNPDGSTRNGAFTTGFIPANLSKVDNFDFKATIKGIRNVAGEGMPNVYKVHYYDSDFNSVSVDIYVNNNTHEYSKIDENTLEIRLGAKNGTYMVELGTNYYKVAYVKFLICISSSAITVDRVPADLAITTNEPKTAVGYGWRDTAIIPENYMELLEKTHQNTANIEDVSNRVAALEGGGGITPAVTPTIPYYWEDAVNVAIDKVKALQDEGGNDVLNFVWFSDVHYGGSKKYIGNIGILCAKVMDTCDIALALMCGDTLTAGANELATEDAVLKMLEDSWDIYSPIGTERLMLIAGNHEDAYGKYTPETGDVVHYTNKADPKKIWNKLYRPQATDFRRVFGGNGTYFWVDNVPQKVRFVCLNSSCYDGEPIPNGTVKAMSFGFGAEQLEWLENTALAVEDGWSVAVCTHVPPISSYASLFSGSDYSEVRRIIAESTENIIAVFTGHMHRDNVVTGDLPCPIVTITCAINTPYDGTTAERVAGTDKETAFDVVSINKATKTIKCIRIGAGSDREVVYYVDPTAEPLLDVMRRVYATVTGHIRPTDTRELNPQKCYTSQYTGNINSVQAGYITYTPISSNSLSISLSDEASSGLGVEFPVPQMEVGKTYTLSYVSDQAKTPVYLIKYNGDTTYNSNTMLAMGVGNKTVTITPEEGYIYSILFAVTIEDTVCTYSDISLTEN